MGLLALGLGGLELGLHVGGVGHSPHFTRAAVTATDEPVWRENRWATAPYFGEHRVRRPWPLRLPREKASETYRIFVLGSSAAMGDPEPSFSLARVLDSMLTAAYPEIRFEVVNAAITAINSHVVRGIAADAARLDPDLFIVYEGHNEVIGPFGPTGVFSRFQRGPLAVRAADTWQRSRTGQWLSGVVDKSPEDDESWRGMEMFIAQQIAESDPRLDAVRAHFAANLRAIGGSAREAGATVLFCTVLTNQRDFAPFMPRHRSDLTAADTAAWETHYAQADAALATGDLRTADRLYRAAWAIDDQHAELAFRLGRLALQRSDPRDATRWLRRALELDTLRFRADGALNEIVRQVGNEFAAQGGLVDLAAALARTSPQGIPGDDLLYEHVHLNFHGTYLAARELFPRIGADLVERGWVSRFQGAPFSESEARRRLGYNAHEQTMIALELVSRFGRAPFTGQSDNAQRLFAWSERATRGQALLDRPSTLDALRLGAARSLQLAPGDWVLQRNTGAMLVARGAAAEALPMLEAAAAWIDDDVDTLMALGLAQEATGDTAAATATFAKVRALEPNYPGLSEPL